jgi:ribonucleoside-diphosphate reductase alpha chain
VQIKHKLCSLQRNREPGCVPCDTWILTSEGSKQVNVLCGKPFTAIVDGREYKCTDGFFKIGDVPVFKVETSSGFELRATANHKIYTANKEWIQVYDLKKGDLIAVQDHSARDIQVDYESMEFCIGWVIGSLYGDGEVKNNQTAYLDYLNRVDGKLFSILQEFMTHPNELTNVVEDQVISFQIGILRGWFDVDGFIQCIPRQGVTVRITCNKLNSLKRAQRMLLRIGITSNIYHNHGNVAISLFNFEAVHVIVISKSSLVRFAEIVGFSDKIKSETLQDRLSNYKHKFSPSKFSTEVLAITLDDTCIVYDASVYAFSSNGLYSCGICVI